VSQITTQSHRHIPDVVFAVADIPVGSSGNNSFTPFNNKVNPPNPNARYRCYFDLNYLDELQKGRNGPGSSLTSFTNQNIPTTYALQYTSFARSSSQSVASGTSTPASSAVSGTNAANQPTTSNAQTLPSNNSNSGLSSGAKAGIAVGAIAGILILLGLGFIVWRNKRRVDNLESRISAGYGVGNPNSQGVQTSSAVHDDLPVFRQTYAMEMQAQPDQAPPPELPRSNVAPPKR
jgi:hypothetical protein